MRVYGHFEGGKEPFTCALVLDEDSSVGKAVEVFLGHYRKRRGDSLDASELCVTAGGEQLPLGSRIGDIVKPKGDLFFALPSSSSSLVACEEPVRTEESSPPQEAAKQDMMSEEDKEGLMLAEKEEGNAWAKKGKWEQAAASYSRAIAILPAVALFTNRALAYHSLGRHQEALDDAEAALRLEKGNTKALYRAGKAAAALRRPKEAASYFSRGRRITKTKKEFAEFSKCLDAATKEAKEEERLQKEREEKERIERERERDAKEAKGNILSGRGGAGGLKGLTSTPAVTGEGEGDGEHMQKALQQLYSSLNEGQTAFQKGRYRRARAIFREVIRLVPTEKNSLQHLAAIEILSNRPHAAAEVLATATEAHPEEMELHILHSEALSRCNRHTDALKALEKAQELDKDGTNKSRLIIAKCNAYRQLGNTQGALALIAPLLQENMDDAAALLEYAHLMQDREPKESMKVVLRLVAMQTGMQPVRKLLVDLVAQHGEEQLLEQLGDAAHSSSALAFLALIFKDHGGISTAVSLFKKAYELKPSSATVALNYVHALEVTNDLSTALGVLESFLEANTALNVPTPDGKSKVTAGDVSEALKASTPACLTDAFKVVSVDKSLPELAAEELDLLAVFFTVAKLLYVSTGDLQRISRVVRKVEECRRSRELHTTSIRNEHAYYCCIAQLLACKEFPLPSGKPIYIMGDSHCLTPSWSSIEVKGEQRLLWPKLVTGCKMWHLNKESQFFPKANFYAVADSLERGADVVFLFGEIDCREGLLVAVEKCKYESLDEAATHTVNVFLEAICAMVEEKGIKAYVHPVVPVLNETRPVVMQFNEILRPLVEKSPGLTWLDFFPRLLNSEGGFEEKYALDGTHMSPAYLSLLQESLNAV